MSKKTKKKKQKLKEEKETINQPLVDDVVNRIDTVCNWTWPVVKLKLIEMIVDMMPSKVLQRLTGETDAFHKAEEILCEFYWPPEQNERIIIDSFHICGEEQTLYALEGLNLDEIPKPESTDRLNQDDST